MRTETDLLEVFTQLATEMPDVDVAVTRRPQHTRARILAVAAAALVVAGGGIAVGLDHPTDGATPAGPPSGSTDWTYEIGLDLPAGWTWDQRQLLAGGVQVANVGHAAAGSDGAPCTVTLDPGDVATNPVVDGAPTRVGTIAAVAGKLPADGTTGPADVWHVQWSPAPGRIADATCADDSGDVAGARQLGAALRLAPTRFAVPFTYSRLPAGLGLAFLASQSPASAGEPPRLYGTLTAGSVAPSGASDPASDAPASVEVTVESAAGQKEAYRDGVRLADVDGRQVWRRPTAAEYASKHPGTQGPGSTDYQTLTVVDGDRLMTLTSSALSTDGLVGLVDSLRLAPDLGDVSTWYDSTSFGR